jgi:hypothetical protein
VPVNALIRVADSAGNSTTNYDGPLSLSISDPVARRPGPDFFSTVRSEYILDGPNALVFGTVGFQVLTVSGAEPEKLAPDSVTVNVQPFPPPAPGQPGIHYVRPGAGGAMDGSYQQPWSSVGTALAARTTGGAFTVADGSSLILLAGTHAPFTLNRRMNVLGESIPFSIVGSQPGRPAVRVLAGAGGSSIRRLNVQPAAGPPLGRGIEVHGAEDVTISNCLFSGGRPALELNESLNTLVHNCGFMPSADTSVIWRYSSGALWNGFFEASARGAAACDFYAFLADPGTQRIVGASSFGSTPEICRDPNVPVVEEANTSSAAPSWADAGYQVPAVDDTELVDEGVDCPSGIAPCPQLPDRDGSTNDRGAYGGPFGEVRREEVGSLIVVPGGVSFPLLIVVLAAGLLLVRWLRRRPALGP